MSGFLCPSSPDNSKNMIEAALTNYAACHHDVEAPIDADNRGVFFLNSHVRLDEIEDGLANTIFVGEKKRGGDELGWASGTRATLRNTGTPLNRTLLHPFDLAAYSIQPPDEMNADPPIPPGIPEPNPDGEGPLPANRVGGFGSFHPGGANFLLGDGSVHYLRDTINFRVYQLLGNRRDGEPIGGDQF